jgi:hypothetical protein
MRPLSLPAAGSITALMSVGLARVHRGVHSAFQLIWRRRVDADAAERLHHLVVARALDEHGRRRIRSARHIDVGAAIDAVIVEDDDADRQAVAADGLHLHPAEAERAVAFDREHRLAGFDRGRNRRTHADAHHAPGADVEALARLVHVDDAAREIERVGAFVDQDRIGTLLDDGAQNAQRAVIIHRRFVVHQTRRHLRDVLVLLGIDRVEPVGGRRRPVAAHLLEKRRHARADIAHQRCRDLDVAVHLPGLDVDMDEFLRMRLAPRLALAVGQQPVQTRADQHHDVRILQHRRTRGTRTLRMQVGQETFRHAHGQERCAALLHEGFDVFIGLRIRRTFAQDDQRTLRVSEHVERALDRSGRRNLRGCGVDHLHQ